MVSLSPSSIGWAGAERSRAARARKARSGAARSGAAPARWLALLALLAVLAGAPGAAAAEPAPSRGRVLAGLELRRSRAIAERAAGVGVAALALASVAVGGVLVGASGQAAYDQGQRYQLAGTLAVITGVTLLLPGAALAIDGQNRLTEVSWRMRLLTGMFIAPGPSTVVAGLGFAF